MIIDQIVEPADDAALISELSSDREPVLLVDHQRDVGRRARELAEALGLDPALADVLEAAGLHHDDGKAEPRFQRILEAGTPSAEVGSWPRAASPQAAPGGTGPATCRRNGATSSSLRPCCALSSLMQWTS